MSFSGAIPRKMSLPFDCAADLDLREPTFSEDRRNVGDLDTVAVSAYASERSARTPRIEAGRRWVSCAERGSCRPARQGEGDQSIEAFR